MAKYTKYDFMPKGEDEISEDTEDYFDRESVTREPMEPLDLSPEVVDEESNCETVELGVPVPRNENVDWAKIVSGVFSPLLIPVYCVALAMWITPLSHVSENARLGVTLVVLLLTAVAPMSYMLAMMRLGRIQHIDMRVRKHRIAPTVIIVVGLVLAAIYIYRVYAPVWLVMILLSGAGCAIVYFFVNFYTLVSGHAMGMGMLTAIVYYLGSAGLADVAITPWVMGVVLLSGLVCSARLALERHSVTDVSVGYIIGVVVTYGIMHVRFFEQLTAKI